ncbi:MAG: hypothetical protein AAGE84_05465 [Cyanobacteria bacterium P01_G01_bin.39]
MAEFTVSELNKENITNLYLYGELDQPTDLVDDNLIRRPDQFEVLLLLANLIYQKFKNW